MPMTGRPVAGQEEGRVLVSIHCAPGSDMLEATHAFLTAYAASRARPLIAQRLSLAAYELLANGLNYGSVSGDVTTELVEARSQIIVRVSNDAIGARVQMLSDHVARVRANAEATVLEEMRRSVSGGMPRPMLGLARIAHEAAMLVDVSVRDRRVTVTASARD